MSVYIEKGYRDRNDYLRHLALENDVPVLIVLLTANMLGPSEDFDGLISLIEDYEA